MKKTFFRPLAVSAVTALAFSLSLSSCSNEGESNDNDSLPQDTAVTQDSTPTVQQYAQVPSPGEMFTFMKMVGAQNAKPEVLNPTANQTKYESKKDRAVNFGIYSADLLYCSTFKLPQALKYFATVKTMGDKLQVTTSITPADEDRINKNIGNSDSLVAVSNEKYYAAFANLEANQRGTDLSLMLAGGWVESLYLMTTMVKDFEKDNKAVARIGEQKYSLDNLVEYMKKYESDEDVNTVLKQMNELKTLFDDIPAANDAGTMNSKNGKRVLGGGGSKVTMTKEQFERIKAKLTEIRNDFITV